MTQKLFFSALALSALFCSPFPLLAADGAEEHKEELKEEHKPASAPGKAQADKDRLYSEIDTAVENALSYPLPANMIILPSDVITKEQEQTFISEFLGEQLKEAQAAKEAVKAAGVVLELSKPNVNMIEGGMTEEEVNRMFEELRAHIRTQQQKLDNRTKEIEGIISELAVDVSNLTINM